jgi:hypothetical protein
VHNGEVIAGIATGYGLDDRGPGVRFSEGAGNFSFSTAFRPALGPTHSPVQLVSGSVSLKVKRLRHEADQSAPSCADVKNAWLCTFMA